MKLATIDIGTHSVLLLITEKNQSGAIISIADEATLTRIGEGMGSHNIFVTAGMERTLAVLKKYKTICDKHGVKKIIAVGTAAFRKAGNAKEFVAQVQKECGIAIEIISGEREAALTWRAASTDFGNDIVVVDIGGGSTEIIEYDRTMVRSCDGKKTKCISLPIGSVILTEQFCHSDPISDHDYKNLKSQITKALKNYRTIVPSYNRTLIATAGTATTLGAIQKKMTTYKHAEIHGSKLTLQELKKIIADLKSKTIAERKKIAGLEPGRADVILAGATLLEKIASHFSAKEITVSDRGVRWGLVYETQIES